MIDSFNLYYAFNEKAQTLSLPFSYSFVSRGELTNLPQNEISIVEMMADQNGNILGIPDNSSEFMRGFYQLGVYVPKTENNGSNTCAYISQQIKELFVRKRLKRNGQSARTTDVSITQLMPDDTHFKMFCRVFFTAVG